MLILRRKAGESIVIDDNIVVTIERFIGNTAVVSVKAPPHIHVIRQELHDRIKRNEENGK